jgi:hypothetical protein
VKDILREQGIMTQGVQNNSSNSDPTYQQPNEEYEAPSFAFQGYKKNINLISSQGLTSKENKNWTLAISKAKRFKQPVVRPFHGQISILK